MKDFFKTIFRWSGWYFAILTAFVVLDAVVHASAPVLFTHPICVVIYILSTGLFLFSTLAGLAGNFLFFTSGLFYLFTIKKTPMQDFKNNANLWEKSFGILQSYSYTGSGYVYSFIPRNIKNFILTGLFIYLACASTILPFTFLVTIGAIVVGSYILDFVLNYSLSEILFNEQEKLEEQYGKECN